MIEFEMEPYVPRYWRVGHKRRIEIGPKSVIMGILNVTPDSFSDGGNFIDPEFALERANELIAQGADIIDVGGESTRPGAQPVDEDTEQKRVLPVVKLLAEKTNTLISIDTYRSGTAKAAVTTGAHIINDVWAGSKDPEIVDVAVMTNSGYIAMHTSRNRKVLEDPVLDQIKYFEDWEAKFPDCGISDERLVIDPGIGFGKNKEVNLELLNRLDELHDLGLSYTATGLLVGTSRKRFLGAITGREPIDRGAATAATSVIARLKGAAIFRVHDIVENKDALAVADALIAKRFGWPCDV